VNALVSYREIPISGWVAIDEFEDLLSNLCDIKIITSRRRATSGVFTKIRNAYLGPFKIDECNSTGELLLIVARKPSDLSVVRLVRQAKQRFRYVAGFVIDSYFTEDFTNDVREFDHVFCTAEAGVDAARRLGGRSSVLRQGFDCLTWACRDASRCIDLIGIGRQPATFHRAFQEAFHHPDSQHLYLHSPIGAAAGTAVWGERPMMLKLLQRSKISLAFHLLTEPEGNRPRSSDFVTSRWLESLTCGCLVVGKRPIGIMADEMFDWPNATIELSDKKGDALDTIIRFANDAKFLTGVRSRNVLEMCRRHDWRYRIRDIYSHFDLALPQKLMEDLKKLGSVVARLESEKQAVDKLH
jgi:hypothetical protein